MVETMQNCSSWLKLCTAAVCSDTQCNTCVLLQAGTCPVCRQSVIVSGSAADAGRHGNDDDDTAEL